MMACSHGNKIHVEMLLEAGADVNATEKDGGTALTIAVAHGHTEVVRVLLRWGADVNIVNKVLRISDIRLLTI